MNIRENVLISELTTMQMGGAVKYVIEVENNTEIPEIYQFARLNRLPIFILGGGANTLGKDEGFNGIILINRIQGIELKNMTIRAGGGEEWDKVVELACQNQLTGVEALSKIPGTVGAAPVQNIGAYGQEISQVLDNVEVYDSFKQEFKVLEKKSLEFSYRKSIFNTSEKGRYFIVAVSLKLGVGEMKRPFYDSLEKYIAEHEVKDFSPMSIRKMVSAIRTMKLPDPKKIASAGSFFKNVYLTKEEAERAKEKHWPVYNGKDGYKINAGWFIEQAGLKGQLLYGMRVSKSAPLVLINESATGYKDLAKARGEIVGRIYDQFGVWLEQEPVEIEV